MYALVDVETEQIKDIFVCSLVRLISCQKTGMDSTENL
jgi:hypothetical protein